MPCVCCTQVPTFTVSLLLTSLALYKTPSLIPTGYTKLHKTSKYIRTIAITLLTTSALILVALANSPTLRSASFVKLCTMLSTPSPLDIPRCATVGQAKGDVLELGPGPGTNFRCFKKPGQITSWLGVEPNLGFSPSLQKSALENEVDFPVSTMWLEGGALPVEDGKFDSVVGTHVLCSVGGDPAAVLANVKRVLKVGGVYYFMEHVLAPPSSTGLVTLRDFQLFLQPVNVLISDGCTFRDVHLDIEKAFGGEEWEIEMETFDAPMPLFPFVPHLKGKVTKVK